MTPINAETIRRQRQVIFETQQELLDIKTIVETRKIEIQKELDWQRNWHTGVDILEGVGTALINAYLVPVADDRNHLEIAKDAEVKRKAIENDVKLLESDITLHIGKVDQLLGSADDYLNNPDKVRIYLNQTKAFELVARVTGIAIVILSAFLLFSGVRSKPINLGLTVSGGLAGITAATCLIFSKEQK